MPRGPRLDAPLGLYHVIARGIERRPLFRDDHDRAAFLSRLDRLVHATASPIYAWALLSNHWHLLLRRGNVPLSTLLQRLLTGYAVSFNRRHRRTGHLFQNRFKSILVEEDAYLQELVRYIHLNPVRARVLSTLDELDRYPWTGHAVILGRCRYPAQDTAFILAQFGGRSEPERQTYRAFIEAGVTAGRRRAFEGGGLRRSLGVWQASAQLRRGRERWPADERILGSPAFVRAILAATEEPPVRPLAPRADTAAVVAELTVRIAARCGVSAREVATNSQRRAVVAARAIVGYLAVRQYALSPTHVAGVLGVSRQTVLYGVAHAAQLLARQNWPADLLLP